MGLVGGYLVPLTIPPPTCGSGPAEVTSAFLSPAAFVKDPVVWVRAMSKYGATMTQAPDFAYRLCAARFNALPIHAREALGLDLSSLRHCLNAAERIDPRTSAVFAAAFEACGYSPGAMFHGYGLAESVVYVCDGPSRSISICGSSLERDKRAVVVVATGIDGRASSVVDVRRVASVGAPRGDVEVCVVHAARRARCADGEVGEIWVRSASIASGFWRRDGGDADDDGAFGATLADDVDGKRGGAFLRTGDEGFARDGELFVTGRSKDLIVVGGRNFAPEDIERTIRDADASEGWGDGTGASRARGALRPGVDRGVLDRARRVDDRRVDRRDRGDARRRHLRVSRGRRRRRRSRGHLADARRERAARGRSASARADGAEDDEREAPTPRVRGGVSGRDALGRRRYEDEPTRVHRRR